MVHFNLSSIGKMRAEIYSRLEDDESSTETQGSFSEQLLSDENSLN